MKLIELLKCIKSEYYSPIKIEGLEFQITGIEAYPNSKYILEDLEAHNDDDYDVDEIGLFESKNGESFIYIKVVK